MNFSKKALARVKKIILDTPFNRNYIADSALKGSIKEAAPYVKGIVLDVGCGEKPYEYLFEHRVHQYVGVDIPNAFPDDVSEYADVYGSGCNLPFRGEVFDTVICTQVLEHIEEPLSAFKEFARVLKRGGILVVTASKTWEKRMGASVPDYFRYTDDGLSQLARRHNMETIYTRECRGFFAMMGQLLARFLNKELIYRKAVYEGIDKNPNILAALFVLPLIAFVQIIFLILDKLYYSRIDTLYYILVARKG